MRRSRQASAFSSVTVVPPPRQRLSRPFSTETCRQRLGRGITEVQTSHRWPHDHLGNGRSISPVNPVESSVSRAVYVQPSDQARRDPTGCVLQRRWLEIRSIVRLIRGYEAREAPGLTERGCPEERIARRINAHQEERCKRKLRARATFARPVLENITKADKVLLAGGPKIGQRGRGCGPIVMRPVDECPRWPPVDEVVWRPEHLRQELRPVVVAGLDRRPQLAHVIGYFELVIALVGSEVRGSVEPARPSNELVPAR